MSDLLLKSCCRETNGLFVKQTVRIWHYISPATRFPDKYNRLALDGLGEGCRFQVLTWIKLILCSYDSNTKKRSNNWSFQKKKEVFCHQGAVSKFWLQSILVEPLHVFRLQLEHLTLVFFSTYWRLNAKQQESLRSARLCFRSAIFSASSSDCDDVSTVSETKPVPLNVDLVVGLTALVNAPGEPTSIPIRVSQQVGARA